MADAGDAKQTTDTCRARTRLAAGLALMAAAGLLSGACSSGGPKSASNSGSTSPTASPSSPTTANPASPSTSTSPSTSSSPTTTTSPTSPSSSPGPGTTGPSTSKPAPPPATTGAPSNLTLQQQAGQRIIYSYQGLTPPAHLLDLIRQGHVGRRHLLRRQHLQPQPRSPASSPQLRQAQQQSPVHLPLLLMTDQEGGIVRRLPGPPDPVGEADRRRAPNPVGAATSAGHAARARTWPASA